MVGDFYINETDVYSEYGVYVREGIAGLISWPSSKDVDVESYNEEDGVRADLSALKLNSHNFTLSLACKAENADLRGFYEWIGTKPYAAFNFASIGLQKTLRLAGITGIDWAERLSLFSLSLVDDAPMKITDETYLAPIRTIPVDNTIKIDGTALSEYGVYTIDGTQNGLRSLGAVKPLMVRDVSTMHGNITDDGFVQTGVYIEDTYGSAQIALHCLMVAPSLTTLWRNYDALLYDLIREKDTDNILDRCKRSLYVAELNKTLSVWYDSQTVDWIYAYNGKYAICFKIILTPLIN